MNGQVSLRPFTETLIIVFCVWHASAVLLTLMPNTIAVQAHDIVRPYIQITSQWQSWDIFSPNPMRRSSTYRIDLNKHGVWQPVQNISYNTLDWRERAKELKILERMEDNWGSVVPFYLRPVCKEIDSAGGLTLRLVAVSTVLPSRLDQLEQTALTKKITTERTLGTVLCTHS